MTRSVRRLVFLQVNDLHGYLDSHWEIFDLLREGQLRPGGGLARVAAVFNAVRREAPDEVVALDSGDTFHGTLPAVATRGEALIEPFRALALDAMTVHWELAYGLDRVRALGERLGYPILAVNLHADGPRGFPPFTVLSRGGLRVGVVGLAAVVGNHLLRAAGEVGVTITIGEPELRESVHTLRAEHDVDLVVALSHLGLPQDCKLAALVPGLDIILSGHTHNRLEQPIVVGDTVIVQSGAHGSFVGRLDVEVGRDGLVGWKHALLELDETREPDPDMLGLVGRALRPFAPARTDVLAETELALHRYSMLESTMDNLLLDAVAEAAGTRLALSNGWRYGAPIQAGPLTLSDVWNIVPADPPVSVIDLDEAGLRRLFEDNLNSTFACDPWEQRGGYMKRCRGLEMTVKLENPTGHRIQDFRVDGRRLRRGERVAVAFLGEQAVPLGTAGERRATGVRAVEALERHLRRHRHVTPALRDPVRII